MRDSGDVCGARNTQFEQEFFGLFRAEKVSAYDWRDRVGDFCVADYLAERDTVHVMNILHDSVSTCATRVHACQDAMYHASAFRPRALIAFGSQWATTHVRTAIDGMRRVFLGRKWEPQPSKGHYRLMAIHSPERNRS